MIDVNAFIDCNDNNFFVQNQKDGGHDGLEPVTRTGSVFVTDNTIEDAGIVFLSAIGILVIHSANNLLAHNHIHHLRYSGISCGWVWGYDKSNTYNNKIEARKLACLRPWVCANRYLGCWPAPSG